MTGQDWAIIAGGWLALAIVIGGFWLDQRQLAKRLHRHRRQLDALAGTASAHGAALARADLLPTASHQPVGKAWSGRMVDLGPVHVRRPPSVLPLPAPAPELSDIEQALADAGRGLTGVELAQALDRKPWDLLPDLDRLLRDKRVVLAGGHTLGRSTYELPAGDTLRLPSGMVVSGG